MSPSDRIQRLLASPPVIKLVPPDLVYLGPWHDRVRAEARACGVTEGDLSGEIARAVREASAP